MKIDLEQLYNGYVLSFHTLSIPVFENWRDQAQFTHQIISYWARVGLSLGYYSWCEADDRKDIGWYDLSLQHSKTDNPYVLHIEVENQSDRIKHTLSKLNKSKDPYKLGVLFNNNEYDKDMWDNELQKITTSNALIITTWWKTEEELERDEFSTTVTGHIINDGSIHSLQPAYLLWGKYGTLRMVFKEYPNWK